MFINFKKNEIFPERKLLSVLVKIILMLDPKKR